MKRVDFYDGVPFKLLGVVGTLVYSKEREVLTVIKASSIIAACTSVIFEDDDNMGFTAMLPVFGVTQPVLVKFAACEEVN